LSVPRTSPEKRTQYLFDKYALRATGVMSAMLAGTNFALRAFTCRGVKALRTETAGWAATTGGDEGALLSDGAALAMLESEETDWCRVAGRLERKPWAGCSVRGAAAPAGWA
jgi:hypothetical protein